MKDSVSNRLTEIEKIKKKINSLNIKISILVKRQKEAYASNPSEFESLQHKIDGIENVELVKAKMELKMLREELRSLDLPILIEETIQI